MTARVSKHLYDDLKDSLGAAQVTIRDLQDRLENALSALRLAERQQEQKEAHNLVLQSDRDRLTATIEALSRRLASPSAETDATRAGWRSASRQHQAAPEEWARKHLSTSRG